TLQAKVAATQAALPNATVAAPVPTASVVADGGNGVTVPRKALWSRMAASRTAAAPAPAPYVAPYAAPYTAPQGLPPTASVVAPETAPEMAADTTAAKKPSSKNSLVMLAAGALALLVVTRKGGTFTSWR
ncbi:MAG TPA: hypothetical protein VHN20_05880, partial [Beijerinckiaceae bacterium]|nr:hypothetical protein [Beijerinckiaceae bacterium]